MTNPAGTKNGKASLHGSFDQKRLGVISAILFGGASFLMTSGQPVQATTHQDVILGGVNLTPWCQKQYGNGFKAKLIAKTAGDWTCERSAGDRRGILVDKACILQYGSKAYKAKALNWNDPYSWKCLGKKAGSTPEGGNAAGCEPGPKQVAFFQHASYKGACSVLGIGKYANSKAMRIKNDSISSFKVGSHVNVTVCKHVAKGRVTNDFFSNPQKCQTFKQGTPNSGYQRIGNDSISSARIFRPTIGYKPTTNGACKPSPGQEAVAVYQLPNYKGNCRLLTIGTYKNSKEMRFKNDSISSIEFGDFSKVSISVREHNRGGGGRAERFNKSVSNLYDSEIGDNAISSAQVFRKICDTCLPPAQ